MGIATTMATMVDAGAMSNQAGSMGDDSDQAVVNVGHLMNFVDSCREEGNAAFKSRNYTAALKSYLDGLDAIRQTEGLPMAGDDVYTVIHARSLLHGNRGQVMIKQERWHAAVVELNEAIRINPNNAKAVWRRS